MCPKLFLRLWDTRTLALSPPLPCTVLFVFKTTERREESHYPFHLSQRALGNLFQFFITSCASGIVNVMYTCLADIQYLWYCQCLITQHIGHSICCYYHEGISMSHLMHRWVSLYNFCSFFFQAVLV